MKKYRKYHLKYNDWLSKLKNVVLIFDGFIGFWWYKLFYKWFWFLMVLKEDMKVPINEVMAHLEKHVKKLQDMKLN